MMNLPSTDMIRPIEESIQGLSENLDTHKATDRFRWQDVYDAERNSIIRDASNAGLKPNEEATVVVPNPTGSFPVNDEAGGVIGITMRNTETTFCLVTITGTQEVTYSSEGLTPGVPITKYFWLRNGDTLTSENVEEYSYTPFTVDTTTVIAILERAVSTNQEALANLQTQIYDLKSGIDNKVLDVSGAVDIANSLYIVSTPLGGRLEGVGFTTLGLLGIRVVSTGVVDVTENLVITHAYDNTSLLGVGEAEPFVLDVNNGVTITSLGMANLKFTPYVSGTTQTQYVI